MNIKKLGRIATPYMIWLIILVFIPLVFMFVLAFLETDAFSLEGAYFSFQSWSKFFGENYVGIAFKNSFKFSFYATVICFFIGYPMAYILAKSKFSNKLIILVLIIVPMWSNSLLRNYALYNIFSQDSIVNDILQNVGLSFHMSFEKEPIIIIGLVLTYLPFMILPIYTVLERMDNSLTEASMDLGATPIRTFFQVTFPLSIKGVVTGILMVFLPSFSGFAIPRILGNGTVIFVGTLIDRSFIFSKDYNFGSILSLAIIFLIFGSMFLVNKFDKDGDALL